MPIYPNLLVHNKCCDDTCYIPSGKGKSQPGIVKQRLEKTVVLQQKDGCTSGGFKRYQPVIVERSLSCHCTYLLPTMPSP